MTSVIHAMIIMAEMASAAFMCSVTGNGASQITAPAAGTGDRLNQANLHASRMTRYRRCFPGCRFNRRQRFSPLLKDRTAAASPRALPAMSWGDTAPFSGTADA